MASDANGSANGGTAASVMEDVLRRLQSPDNAVRGEAEAQFNAAKGSPSVCLEVLAVLATASSDELVREAAAVLLRRTTKELWSGADERVRLGVKSTLLQSIQGDYRDGLRKKVRLLRGEEAITSVFCICASGNPVRWLWCYLRIHWGVE